MTTTTSTSRRSSSDGACWRLTDQPRTICIPRPGGDAWVRWSIRADGDFNRSAPASPAALAELDRRRRALVPWAWTMLDEHHGTTVVDVSSPGQHDGAAGDVAVTAAAHAVLGCWTGDCGPIALIGRDRRVAVVHAGWRGLAAGVIDAAVDHFDEPIAIAVLGATIGPCCYEFGESELSSVASRLGLARHAVRGTTSDGRPALDVATTIELVLARRGVRTIRLEGCTGCSFDGFSHRVRHEPERHVLAAWIGEPS